MTVISALKRFKMNLGSHRDRTSGFIGNLLEHYDNALFGLLAPFIAPLFFSEQDPITALIYTYGMLPLGFLTRPLGSLCFGWIGDRWGRRQALFLSLCGMAIVTTSMGLLPIYQDIGIYAPLLLALGRMLQSFCAAGESIGGAIFVLENTERSKRGLISSFYDASSIAGILIASALVTFMSSQGILEKNWRILFLFGGMTAVFGIFLRLNRPLSKFALAEEIDDFSADFYSKQGSHTQWVDDEHGKKSAKKCNLNSRMEFRMRSNANIEKEFINSAKVNWISGLRNHKRALLSIILASGFSYTTYSLTFTLMNGYVPLITSLTKTDVMQVNTLLLVLDMILLPIFGYLSGKIGKEKVMILGALTSVLGALPLFSLLDHASIGTVIFVRVAIVVSGVAFSAPYHAWSIDQVPPNHRYLILSLGNSLGSQLIGMPSSAICLWLYRTFKWSSVPAIYLMIVGIGAGYIVFRSVKLKKGLDKLEIKI